MLEELALLEQATEKKTMTQVEKEKSMLMKLKLQEMAKIEDVSWKTKVKMLVVQRGEQKHKVLPESS